MVQDMTEKGGTITHWLLVVILHLVPLVVYQSNLEFEREVKRGDGKGSSSFQKNGVNISK